MACKQNLDLGCALVPAPWVLGLDCRGQNTSRIQKSEVYAALYLQARVLTAPTGTSHTARPFTPIHTHSHPLNAPF